MAPRQLGETLGFYGLGWSVFQTVVASGREVTFNKNAVMAIRFGAVENKRPSPYSNQIAEGATPSSSHR